MECGAWLGWQIDYLLWLQNFRDVSGHVFDNFFTVITLFGEVTVPLIVIACFYWAINKRVGTYILWSYVFGFVANHLAKVTACIYRPWILDPRVHPLAQAMPAATGYSFPSGHTAGAVTIWGSLAVSFWKNKIVRYVCLAIILLVMISRNYLGVHTPQDVIVSFLLSSLVLFGVWKLLKYEENGTQKTDVIIVASAFALSAFTCLYAALKPYPIHYLFGKILYDPMNMKIDVLTKEACLFGVFTGWLLEKWFVGFNPETGSVIKRVLRVALGVALLFGIKSAGSIVPFGFYGECVQMFILGTFITFIYPLMIKHFNL